MEFSKKQPAILYLDKNGFYYFSIGLQNILSVAFSTDSVRDMDIVNTITLEAQIASFVSQSHLAPSNITIILSPNITFEKDITNQDKQIQDTEIKKFIDSIPFEFVYSKKYPLNNGVKIIGCNEEFYEAIKVGFGKLGFGVDSVIFYQMMGSDQAFIQTFNPQGLSQLLKRLDHLKQFSIIDEKTKPSAVTLQKTNTTGKNNKMRLYLMIGILGVLLLVLVFLLFRQ